MRQVKADAFMPAKVLVGRAQGQSKVLTELLKDMGATVIAIPFIEIRPPESWRPLDDALKKITTYDWLILTSVNGVQALLARMGDLKIPTHSLSRLNVAAIGPATRKALEKQGINVALTPREYIAEAVVEVLRAQVPGKRVLLVRAQVARDVIPRELADAGAKVDVVAAYETGLPTASRAKLRKLLQDSSRRPNVVAFTSSSTVRNFVKMASGMALDGIRFVSIGPVTSATMRESGLRVDAEAREYTMSGIVGAVAELNL